MTFKSWMKAVDSELIKQCGMPSGCLPDYAYYSAWQCGDSPESTAEDVIENARDY